MRTRRMARALGLWVAAAWLLLQPITTSAQWWKRAVESPPAEEKAVAPPAPGALPAVHLLSRQALALGIQPMDGRPAKDFALPGPDGKAVRLSDFRGKVVFLAFWASWCPACRGDMPKIDAVHRRLKERDFAVLTVAIDTQGEKAVAPFLKEFGLTFPVLLDPQNEVLDRYGVNLIPTIFIIGREGEILGRAIGPKAWDGQEAERYFEALLRATEKPPSASSDKRIAPSG